MLNNTPNQPSNDGSRGIYNTNSQINYSDYSGGYILADGAIIITGRPEDAIDAKNA